MELFKRAFKKLFCNAWLYVTLCFIYLMVYGEVKGQSRYVLLFHEPTGNIYHANLVSPEYNSILDRLNIFDGDDIFNIRSFKASYIHYIGNIQKEKLVDNKIEYSTLKFLPNRRYVDHNQLPEVIKKPTSPFDLYEVDVNGLENLGLTRLTVIMDDSSESLEKPLKDRSDKFKRENSRSGT